MRKLIKTVILGINLTILAFPVNAARDSSKSDLYPKMIKVDLDKVKDEGSLREKLQQIRSSVEILNIHSDELQRLNLLDLGNLLNLEIDCPSLTSININNCGYLQQISFLGLDIWPQNINIKNCPWLQLISIADSNINDQQLKQLLFLVKDNLKLLHLYSCENLQNIDLSMYPNLKQLFLYDCPRLQQNIVALRAATRAKIEIIGS